MKNMKAAYENSFTDPTRAIEKKVSEVAFKMIIKQINKDIISIRDIQEKLSKTTVSKQEFATLERSLDKNRAISMYNDMQMYVDQTLSNFYQRITSDLTCLCREKTMGYFKELQEQQRDLSKKVEKLSVSPKPIPIEEFIGNQSFDRAYFEAEPVPDDILI